MNKQKPRLISIGNYYGVADAFSHLFSNVYTLTNVSKLDAFEYEPTDVILLGGGEDISPSIYGQKPSRYTGAREILSSRDTLETHAFKVAQQNKLGILGICRGAQLICALSGGSLFQHVTNHAGGGHEMVTKEGTVLHVSSAHHQMMNPFKVKHDLIAWSREVRSNVHLIEDEKNVPVTVEPEVVFFPETKGLAIQYHPEFMDENSAGAQYAYKLVSQYLIGG